MNLHFHIEGARRRLCVPVLATQEDDRLYDRHKSTPVFFHLLQPLTANLVCHIVLKVANAREEVLPSLHRFLVVLVVLMCSKRAAFTQ